jgi:hypothetical protein
MATNPNEIVSEAIDRACVTIGNFPMNGS